MTADERNRLRLLVDQAVRAKVTVLLKNADLCGECGGELASRTVGCKRCAERHGSRERRRKRTPEQMAADRAKEAEYRRRHKQKKAAA